MKFKILALLCMTTFLSCTKLEDDVVSPYDEDQPTLFEVTDIVLTPTSEPDKQILAIAFVYKEDLVLFPEKISGFRLDFMNSDFTNSKGYALIDRSEETTNYSVNVTLGTNDQYCIAIRSIAKTGGMSRYFYDRCIEL